MTRTRTLHRWTLAALSAAALALTLAPVAQADGWRRWKHDDHGRWGRPGSRVVIREVDHGGGSALAGLIGGFVLGAAFTHPQPVIVHEQVYAPAPPAPRCHYYSDEQVYAPPAPSTRYRDDDQGYAQPAPQAPPVEQAGRYRYEDGNGERWWDTLDEARDAAAHDRDGPKMIRIVDARDNHVVQTLYWKHDHFISDDDPSYDQNGQYRNDDSRGR